MAFPSRKEINRVLKKLKNKPGTLMLHPNPTALEQFRWDICQQFVIYKRKHNFTQKQFAELAGIDEAKMSKILRHRISEFSTDRLLAIYQKINPTVQLRVS